MISASQVKLGKWYNLAVPIAGCVGKEAYYKPITKVKVWEINKNGNVLIIWENMPDYLELFNGEMAIDTFCFIAEEEKGE